MLCLALDQKMQSMLMRSVQKKLSMSPFIFNKFLQNLTSNYKRVNKIALSFFFKFAGTSIFYCAVHHQHTNVGKTKDCRRTPL